MPIYLFSNQRSAMPHVEMVHACIDHTLQLAGNHMWVIFERRANGMTGPHNSAQQHTGGEQVIHHHITSRQLHR